MTGQEIYLKIKEDYPNWTDEKLDVLLKNVVGVNNTDMVLDYKFNDLITQEDALKKIGKNMDYYLKPVKINPKHKQKTTRFNNKFLNSNYYEVSGISETPKTSFVDALSETISEYGEMATDVGETVYESSKEGLSSVAEMASTLYDAATGGGTTLIEAAIPGVKEGAIDEGLEGMVEAAKETNPALGGLAVLSAEALKSKGNPYQTALKLLAGTTAAKTISDETGLTDLITEKLEGVESQDVLNILTEAARTVVPGLDMFLDLEGRYKDYPDIKPKPEPKDVEEQFDEAAAGFSFWPSGSGPDPNKPDKDKVPHKERTLVERIKTRVINGLKRSLAFHTTNVDTGAAIKMADTMRAAIPVIQSMYTYNELFQVLGIYDQLEKTDANFLSTSADLLETFAVITNTLGWQLGEEYEPLQKYRGIFRTDEGGETKDQDEYEKERKTTREEFGF